MGFFVGFPVGFPVGCPVAFIMGCKEGVSVDAIVGSRVGILGGRGVGNYVSLRISIGMGHIRPVLIRHTAHETFFSTVCTEYRGRGESITPAE